MHASGFKSPEVCFISLLNLNVGITGFYVIAHMLA